MTTEEPPPGVRAMSALRWMLVAAMAIVAALSVVYSFGPAQSNGARGANAQATQYYCPMHPQVVQDHPGDCPICNMTLVLKPSAAAPKQASVAASTPAGTQPPALSVPGLVPLQLDFDRVQLIGIRTARVAREPLVSELRATAVVAADESKFARVHARFSGWIEKLAVATTGQKVRRGQTLASIYSPDLLPAQQEFLAARKWKADEASVGSMADAARSRLELLGMPSAEIDRIAVAGAPSRTVPIVTPIAGYVIRKDVTEGTYVEPGMALFEIADLSKVWMLADVYEQEIGRVHVGQTARVQVEAYPEQVLVGKVGFIFPAVDAGTRTLRVRVELSNKDLTLRPGMYGSVTIELERAEGVAVPVEALIDTGEHQYVFLAKEGGHFEPRLVRAGARAQGKVQILEGLQEGDVIVTTANFMIDSESRLRAAIEGAPTH